MSSEEDPASYRDQLTELFPYIVPFVSPAWFSVWFYRYYALRGGVVCYHWAKAAYARYRRAYLARLEP